MKIKECFWWVFAIIGVCFLSIRCSNIEQDYCCYVNPFIGNAIMAIHFRELVYHSE